jgi:SAM-dependent methyltransferase/uncharacterized membrane protein YbhN (UPF0104 family)
VTAPTGAAVPDEVVATGRPRRGLLFRVKVGFGLLVVAAAAWFLVDNRAEVSRALAGIGWPALLGSIPPALGGVLTAMLAWRALLADLGSPLSVGDAGRVYFTSQLGKYVPGSVWPFVAQVELGRELRVPRAVSFAASLLAIVLSLTVGIAVAAGTLVFGSPDALRSFWWVLLVLPVLVAALHPSITVGAVNVVLRLVRRSPIAVRPTWAGTARAALWQMLSWILLGLHCYVLVAAVGPGGWQVVPLAIGAFALAYCAGVIFLPSPAGAGIREVALTAGLAGALAQPQAIAVVLVSRVVLIVVDVGVAAGWWVVRGRRHQVAGRRPVGSGPMVQEGADVAQADPPGGAGLALAKRVVEGALWTRVRAQRRVTGNPPSPSPVPPTDLLRTEAEWRAAVAECRRLRLPLHWDRPKNWDALGAVSTVLDVVGRDASVLDAGSARYSSVLPWLRLYGLQDLVGNNLEFGADVKRDGVVFRHGDITATDFPDGRFDAVTCMSVIEHGVPVEAFLAESARILRPGGVLVVSTDYDMDPRDVTGYRAYGQPVRLFSAADIRKLVDTARSHGLTLRGELALEHSQRPVHWKRTGLDYTFIRLAFDRV